MKAWILIKKGTPDLIPWIGGDIIPIFDNRKSARAFKRSMTKEVKLKYKIKRIFFTKP